jgi:hypothetical protein
MHPNLEKARVRTGMFGSTESDGFNGAFLLYINGEAIKIIATDGLGWQHVSVSKQNRNKPPNWDIMCQVKDLFWPEDQWVVQFHPAKSEYVNNHPGCLHLWRPTHQSMPTPPAILTGWKGKTSDQIQTISPKEILTEYISANNHQKTC